MGCSEREERLQFFKTVVREQQNGRTNWPPRLAIRVYSRDKSQRGIASLTSSAFRCSMSASPSSVENNAQQANMSHESTFSFGTIAAVLLCAGGIRVFFFFCAPSGTPTLTESPLSTKCSGHTPQIENMKKHLSVTLESGKSYGSCFF